MHTHISAKYLECLRQDAIVDGDQQHNDVGHLARLVAQRPKDGLSGRLDARAKVDHRGKALGGRRRVYCGLLECIVRGGALANARIDGRATTATAQRAASKATVVQW